jgi:hypothetical protein
MPPDPDHSSSRLLHDDMKDSGLLPVLARLVKGYSARHSPRPYAVDVVVALHTTLRLLTRLNTSGDQHRIWPSAWRALQHRPATVFNSQADT